MSIAEHGRLQLTALLIAASVAAPFAVLVWPTAYRYDYLHLGGDNGAGPVFPVRINRFTGAADVLLPHLYAGRLLDLELAWVGNVGGEELPPDLVGEARKNVEVTISQTGQLSAEIFNDTDRRLTRVRWDVTSRQKGEPRTRQFDQKVFIEPNSRASVFLDLGSFGEAASAELTGLWGSAVRPAASGER